MRLRLATWRPMRLFLAWCAYWLTLVLAVLGPAVPILWRATRPDAHGTVSVSFGSGGIQMTIVQDAITVWSRSVSFAALSLWLALPPLVLWVFWLRAQRNARTVSSERAAQAVGP